MTNHDGLEHEFAQRASIARVKWAIEKVMVTHADIGVGVSAFRTIMDLAKRITDLGKKADNAELIRLIADLNLEVAHANMALAEVTNELVESRDKIRELEERLKPEFQLHRQKDGLYYRDGGEGPFCPDCYVSRRKIKLLSRLPGSWKCQDCDWLRV